MKRIGVIVLIICLMGLYGCQQETKMNSEKLSYQNKSQEEKAMKIKVINQTYEIIYLLNESPASLSLYHQLPLDINVENYGDNEKIFYPPMTLDISETPLLQKGRAGTLGYFASWGDVVMYYGKCNAYNGLYVLGEAIEGSEDIEKLTGQIHIERVNE